MFPQPFPVRLFNAMTFCVNKRNSSTGKLHCCIQHWCITILWIIFVLFFFFEKRYITFYCSIQCHWKDSKCAWLCRYSEMPELRLYISGNIAWKLYVNWDSWAYLNLCNLLQVKIYHKNYRDDGNNGWFYLDIRRFGKTSNKCFNTVVYVLQNLKKHSKQPRSSSMF